MLQESDLKAACLLTWSTNMTENKYNQSRFNCLIVTPVKKEAPAWPQLDEVKENKVSVF